jgi:ubiquinol-cytochrome c reductase cytochrome b subunit
MRRPFSFFNTLYSLTWLYLTPSNLSYLWNHGSLAFFFLSLQILTGLALSWYYIAQVDWAFYSVEFIMREVLNGWILRYSHSNGASFFFFVTYLHIARALFYGSYQQPRMYVWLTGLVIYFLMILTAFLGYVLPWGQMSFWAATVITSLATVIPLLGDSFVMLIWGGFGIGQPTLSRFYSFHFVLPFVIFFLVAIHLLFLHVKGSSDSLTDQSLGIDKISFHPYYTIKDIVGIFFILFAYFMFIFFYPNVLGHPLNYIQANPGVTPVHIVPEWYFLPFYGILRAIPSKIFGVLLMLSSLLVLALLPWMTNPDVKQTTYRPMAKFILFFFFFNFIMLGWVGYHVLEEPFILLSRIFCIFYLLFFIVLVGGTVVEKYLIRLYDFSFSVSLHLLVEELKGLIKMAQKNKNILN